MTALAPKRFEHLQTFGHGVDADDQRRAQQPCPKRRAQANRTLREDGDRVADLHAAAFGAAQAGREDIWHEHDLLVAEPVGNRRQVGSCVGHQQVLGPRAVDGVAEAPAAQRAATLRVRAVETVEALPAGRDGADDHALADVILRLEPLAQLVDDANRLVSEDQAVADGILALDDVDVGAADRRGRDADDRLSRSRDRLGTLLDGQPALTAECNCLHHVHALDSFTFVPAPVHYRASRQHPRGRSALVQRAGVLPTVQLPCPCPQRAKANKHGIRRGATEPREKPTEDFWAKAGKNPRPRLVRHRAPGTDAPNGGRVRGTRIAPDPCGIWGCHGLSPVGVVSDRLLHSLTGSPSVHDRDRRAIPYGTHVAHGQRPPAGRGGRDAGGTRLDGQRLRTRAALVLRPDVRAPDAFPNRRRDGRDHWPSGKRRSSGSRASAIAI